MVDSEVEHVCLSSPNLIVPDEARPFQIAPEAIYTFSFNYNYRQSCRFFSFNHHDYVADLLCI